MSAVWNANIYQKSKLDKNIKTTHNLGEKSWRKPEMRCLNLKTAWHLWVSLGLHQPSSSHINHKTQTYRSGLRTTTTSYWLTERWPKSSPTHLQSLIGSRGAWNNWWGDQDWTVSPYWFLQAPAWHQREEMRAGALRWSNHTGRS